MASVGSTFLSTCGDDDEPHGLAGNSGPDCGPASICPLSMLMMPERKISDDIRAAVDAESQRGHHHAIVRCGEDDVIHNQKLDDHGRAADDGRCRSGTAGIKNAKTRNRAGPLAHAQCPRSDPTWCARMATTTPMHNADQDRQEARSAAYCPGRSAGMRQRFLSMKFRINSAFTSVKPSPTRSVTPSFVTRSEPPSVFGAKKGGAALPLPCCNPVGLFGRDVLLDDRRDGAVGGQLFQSRVELLNQLSVLSLAKQAA